ncbi:MAG: hypothetical protein A3F84_16890 [Candidatus Handelsmanbacteria bacterium RIFCSPLOWO2_12_FULL_64_10]|uniref:Spermidine/putrescine ABC transporter substrate-binding protein n=1 Tax=Handelsmanbacteria sp. (strain RIFCSPLOWO2_12_FULL_64_10) TaxID=1817868 RepID=A0A1F6CD93_HANXR|nr:MAG: hypothetical protein A3F84_16890 [Candidatus Handelsmanbacteria bacterium RIFCSPLOWO2_12_FULL_64_10]
MKRRTFLKHSAWGGAAIALGCGGRQGGGRRLNVYNWPYYIGPTTTSDFEREAGVRVTYDNYSDNEEMLAKLQTGQAEYDVIFPSDYMVQIMVKADLLSPLDLKAIPNFKNIARKFRGLPFDPENRHSVPYQWGTVGIGLNGGRIHDPVEGWAALWNPAYKGWINMLDDMRTTLGVALKRLGHSVNSTSKAEVEGARGLLIEQKPLVKTYSSDLYREHLISGDIYLSCAYSGDLFQAAKQNSALRYVLPKEGTMIWVDNVAVPKAAPHRDVAHEFIDFLLRDNVSATISNAICYASPNEASYPLTDPKILSNPAIYPPPEVEARCEFVQDLGEFTKVYDAAWQDIKTA